VIQRTNGDAKVGHPSKLIDEALERPDWSLTFKLSADSARC